MDVETFMIWTVGIVGGIVLVLYGICAYYKGEDSTDDFITLSVTGVVICIGAFLVFEFINDDSSNRSGSSACRVCESTSGYAMVGFGPTVRWECKDCRAIR